MTALSDISDETLKEQLFKREKDFNFSKEAYTEIAKVIISFYLEKKKENAEKYYLESRLITNLDQLDFGLMKEQLRNSYREEQINFTLKHFIDLQQKNLEKTRANEVINFMQASEQLYRYLAPMPEDIKKKIMTGMDIEMEEGVEKVSFRHREYPELEGSIQKPHFDESPVSYSKLDNVILNSSDKAILHHYASGRNQQKSFDQAIESYTAKGMIPQVYRLLHKEDQNDFQQQYSDSYLSKVKVQTRASATDILVDLSKKGIRIMPAKEKGVYLMGIYGFELSTYSKIPGALMGILQQEAHLARECYRIQLKADYLLKMNRTVMQEGLPKSVLSLNQEEFAEKNQQRITQTRAAYLERQEQNDDDRPEQKKKRGLGF